MLPIKGLEPTFGLNREAVEAAQSHLLKHYYTPYQDSFAFHCSNRFRWDHCSLHCRRSGFLRFPAL